MKIFYALCISLVVTACKPSQEKKLTYFSVPSKSTNHVLIENDIIFSEPLKFGEKTHFNIYIHNPQKSRIALDSSTLYVVYTNLGNGSGSTTGSLKLPKILNPEMTICIRGTIYIGPGRHPSDPKRYIECALIVGSEGEAGENVSFERKNGDFLFGFGLGIRTEGQDEHQVYIVKYHIQSADNKAIPYFTLGIDAQQDAAANP